MNHLLQTFRLIGPCVFAWLMLIPLHSLKAQTSDVIMQGFYWNTHPGDVSDPVNGGIWWDTLATVAPTLSSAGFQTVWIPPMTKGFGNLWDMGYGLYDYYDFGSYNQKGSTRTRHGNWTQYQNMVSALHGSGLSIMGDLVLNHRGGGDALSHYEYNAGPWYGAMEWLIFNPASGRFPGVPAHFHPNNTHPDQNADWHNPLFFNDVCYFNQNDQTPPPGGWYHGAPPYGLGAAGDSLIAWGRWLNTNAGIDEFRLDAVKHIDPSFLAKFLVESSAGNQLYAVGEFFDGNGNSLAWYRDAVESNANGGSKNAQMSLFDFDLRDALKAVLNNTSGSADLYWTLGYGGTVWGHGESGLDVVTFLDNHDKDRIGFIGGGAQDGSGNCPPGQIKAGGSCLVIESNPSDHDPIFNNKSDMGYPLILAMEGRPTVFWKDYFWYGMKTEIDWLISLRMAMAQGGSYNSTLQNQDGNGSNNPWWDPGFGGNCNGGNMFAMQRWGFSSGNSDGMVLGINDHPYDQLGMYVNTPFSNKTLKDYSDGFSFGTTQAYSDSRALIRANARDYSWWGLTGQYPKPILGNAPIFHMQAQPGGATHYVILDADDLGQFLVNEAPLERGDQLALANSQGEICGIARNGLVYDWDGEHDMVIEVIGPFPTDDQPAGGAANGMQTGEAFQLHIYDASTGDILLGEQLEFAKVGSSGTINMIRPSGENRPQEYEQPRITESHGHFQANAISRITGFQGNRVIGKEPIHSFPIAEILTSEEAFGLIAYPNPTSGWIHLTTDLPLNSKVEITVFDLVGRTVLEKHEAYSPEVSQFHLDLSQEPAGMYRIVLRSGETVSSVTVQKE
ncbi:alpha-amylase family glycosyl hydrolase [Pontibacter sp. G13]|uniref:T9SS type A sorting domain-containing protein n=1 Tax=Pontibacter sp. G13 TaxID=3074898 RepID=UPI0028891E0F|nr:alpha-amylase family glycosyl hydrolase [Pontibacter sp. G13]WNJ19014.1 alpha-amylase family glycosyl hydrolase [Pontibacter sp. G13]